MKCCIRPFLKVLFLVLLVLAAFGLAMHSSFCVLAEDDVHSKLSAAEDALQRAFLAVLDAENAGANVSRLLAELDVAGKNLTEAEMAYESGGLVEALSKAERCSVIVNSVVDEASALKNSTLLNARIAEWQVFSFSGVGAFVFLVMLVLVWVLFKRFYNGRLLGLRPEARS